jgi:uncharacterized protein (DUF58 family)
MNAIFDDGLAKYLEAVSLCTDSHFNGSIGGNHKTRTHGSSTEFSDYREYVLGDDVRRIDWNIYSRFEKYYIKRFTDERRMHTQIILDGSASMNGSGAKALYALRAAAALGFLSVQGMDKVTVRRAGEFALEDAGGTVSGKEAFYRALTALRSVRFEGCSDFGRAVLSCRDPGLSDGLTVFISDFLTAGNWKKAADYLLFRKRKVLLLQVLSPEEADPACRGRINFIDCEAAGDGSDARHLRLKVSKSDLAAYRLAVKEFFEDITEFCRSRDIFYIRSLSGERLEKSLLEKLYIAGVIG